MVIKVNGIVALSPISTTKDTMQFVALCYPRDTLQWRNMDFDTKEFIFSNGSEEIKVRWDVWNIFMDGKITPILW